MAPLPWVRIWSKWPKLKVNAKPHYSALGHLRWAIYHAYRAAFPVTDF